VIKNNDLISHRVHRHEPPVIGDKINIIHKDDNLVVINKPPSIPVCILTCVMNYYVKVCMIVQVHPCGRYRHNTVWFIMAKEYGLTNLHSMLTSCIIITMVTPKFFYHMIIITMVTHFIT